jgi:hypothetical protein
VDRIDIIINIRASHNRTKFFKDIVKHSTSEESRLLYMADVEKEERLLQYLTDKLNGVKQE